MDYQALAALLFPNVTDTPEMLEEKYPLRNLPEGAIVTRMAPSHWFCAPGQSGPGLDR